jgi:hypothetical protein
MGYLGNQPTIGAYHKLDAISTVNGQATYNLLLDSVAFTPQSANHMLVVVNGIVQSPTTNYNISGSTIVFTSNLVTGDVINEIRVFGDILNIGTPSDATVTNAKTNFVSTSSGAGLSIKGDGTTDGTVQLNCSQNSHGVKIASPAHSSGQSYTIKLPTENIATDKIMKVASISGSGTTAIGQMSFVDEPSGGLKLLNHTSISSATASVVYNNSLITSSHNIYKIVWANVVPATSNVALLLKTSTDNGSNFLGYITGHRYNGINLNNNANRNTQTNGAISMATDVSSTALYGCCSGEITIGNVNNTSGYKHAWGKNVYNAHGGNSIYWQDHGHVTSSASDIDYLQVLFSSGNIASGEISLYGYAKS